MTWVEAIIGTGYEDEEHVPMAVAEAMWHLNAVYMHGPPLDVNIYGGDGEQYIGVGLVFETHDSLQRIEDCGVESVEKVSVEPIDDMREYEVTHIERDFSLFVEASDEQDAIETACHLLDSIDMTDLHAFETDDE